MIDSSQRENPPAEAGGFSKGDWIRGLWKMLYATAAVGVFPVLLDHPVVAAEGLVEFGSSGGARRRAAVAAIAGRGRAEVEVALVRVLLAGVIEPRVQVRIGDSFFLLMGQ